MIIGHKNQWKFLVKSAELSRLSHAYLFSGQDKVGKKTLAIEFVKFLNCQSKDFSKRPCQVCRNCQDIQKMVYPDFILVEPDPLAKEIHISQIRRVLDKLSFRPYSAEFKIAILDKAHSMSQEAQSCFLKFLEEPKGKTILILITEFPELLLPTILSRLQRVKFFPVKSAEIERYLLSQGIPKDKVKYFSSLSLGRPGIAINFLLDPQEVENQRKFISDLIKISNSDLAFRFQYAKTISEQNSEAEIKNLKEILDIWLSYFRGIFVSRITERKKTAYYNHYSLSKLKNIIKLIQSTNFLISTTNINPRLALEILMIEL